MNVHNNIFLVIAARLAASKLLVAAQAGRNTMATIAIRSLEVATVNQAAAGFIGNQVIIEFIRIKTA